MDDAHGQCLVAQPGPVLIALLLLHNLDLVAFSLEEMVVMQGEVQHQVSLHYSTVRQHTLLGPQDALGVLHLHGNHHGNEDLHQLLAYH